MTWHTSATVGELTDLWPDVETIDPATLDLLLDVAREQVIAYAPRAEAPPARYFLAQIRQAQNIYRASVADAGGGMGDGESFQITPHPLDWHVKALIRPNRGRPRVR